MNNTTIDQIINAVIEFSKKESIPEYGDIRLIFKKGKLIYIGKEVKFSCDQLNIVIK